jgi:hypothetical protein
MTDARQATYDRAALPADKLVIGWGPGGFLEDDLYQPELDVQLGAHGIGGLDHEGASKACIEVAFIDPRTAIYSTIGVEANEADVRRLIRRLNETLVENGLRPEGSEAEFNRMRDVADDYESNVLDNLRDRAGITWTCPVAPWTNPKGERCDDCGRDEDEAQAAAMKRDLDNRGEWFHEKVKRERPTVYDEWLAEQERGERPSPESEPTTWGEALGIDEGPAFFNPPEDPS